MIKTQFSKCTHSCHVWSLSKHFKMYLNNMTLFTTCYVQAHSRTGGPNVSFITSLTPFMLSSIPLLSLHLSMEKLHSQLFTP